MEVRHAAPGGATAVLFGAIAFLMAACGHTSIAIKVSNQASPSPVVSVAPSPTPVSVAGCPGGTAVSTSTDLALALAAATPGTTIVMLPGNYPGQFIAEAQGTASAPISLCGTRDSVIDGGDIKSGYALYLHGASWWRLVGFSVQGAQKGVVTDHASHNDITGLYVHDIGDEGIHLRSFSSDNIVEGNTVRRTGLLRPKFGEGIYVGSANSNWCKYSACSPDKSDRNVIRNNDISDTTAENIDIKEGTTGGTIGGNHLSGVGMNPASASAWVNVKGNDWTVVGNVGQTSVRDGFQVHEVYAGWGLGNIFHQNQAVVDGPGYGFYVQHDTLQTLLGCDNTASGAALGLSNAPCSR